MDQNSDLVVETKIVIKKKALTRSIFTIDEEDESVAVLSSRTGGWANQIQEIGTSEYFENDIELNKSITQTRRKSFNYK
jgi:hypothetical protein